MTSVAHLLLALTPGEEGEGGIGRTRGRGGRSIYPDCLSWCMFSHCMLLRLCLCDVTTCSDATGGNVFVLALRLLRSHGKIP